MQTSSPPTRERKANFRKGEIHIRPKLAKLSIKSDARVPPSALYPNFQLDLLSDKWTAFLKSKLPGAILNLFNPNSLPPVSPFRPINYSVYG